MARKKSKDQDWTTNSAAEYMQEQFRLQITKGTFGAAQDSAEAAVSDVGIKFPHLCQRVLFQRTTYPLQRTMILFGPPGSNKSSLLYYFYDLVRRAGGKYFHLEVEDKDTPTLRLALTEYDRKAGWVRPCTSMDDFMASFKTFVNWYSGECAKVAGPGKRVPYQIGVDSLVAKLTEEAAAVIDRNDGVPGRRYADEARALSDWFKMAPGMLQNLPISLIAVNHDKPKAGARPGTTTHSAPGGSAPNFYATYRILVQKVQTIPPKADGFEGNRIALKVEKNSLGADGQRCEVEFLWGVVPAVSESGKPTVRQYSFWNWYKATTEMLFKVSTACSGKKSRRGDVVDAVVGIRKGSQGRYYGEGIGISSADAVTPLAFGKALEARADLLAALEPQLGVHPSYEYTAGRDFDEQLAEAVAAVDDYIPAPLVDELDLDTEGEPGLDGGEAEPGV